MPLFITGLPRSGTTLVRLLFDKHPDIAIPHETGLVRKCYDRRLRLRLTGFKAGRYNNLKAVLGEEVVQAFDALPLTERNNAYKVSRSPTGVKRRPVTIETFVRFGGCSRMPPFCSFFAIPKPFLPPGSGIFAKNARVRTSG